MIVYLIWGKSALFKFQNFSLEKLLISYNSTNKNKNNPEKEVNLVIKKKDGFYTV